MNNDRKYFELLVAAKCFLSVWMWTMESPGDSRLLAKGAGFRLLLMTIRDDSKEMVCPKNFGDDENFESSIEKFLNRCQMISHHVGWSMLNRILIICQYRKMFPRFSTIRISMANICTNCKQMCLWNKLYSCWKHLLACLGNIMQNWQKVGQMLRKSPKIWEMHFTMGKGHSRCVIRILIFLVPTSPRTTEDLRGEEYLFWL